MSELRWHVGQEVALCAPLHAPTFTTVTSLIMRLGEVFTVETADGNRWHRTGNHRNEKMRERIEPATPAHHERAKRDRLISRLCHLREPAMLNVPTEALEAFAAAIDSATKPS